MGGHCHTASASLSRVTARVSPSWVMWGGGGTRAAGQQPLPRQQRKTPLLVLGALSLHPCHVQPDWGAVTPAGPGGSRS